MPLPLSPKCCLCAFIPVFLVGLILPLAAVAESPPDERSSYDPPSEQLDLNQQGVEALIEGDYARSVALLTEAYRLGEVNIIALNLGRAYHALGQCDNAIEKLEQVSKLPVVDTPPPDRVDATARDYLEEAKETCVVDEETELDDPDELETKSDELDDPDDPETPSEEVTHLDQPDGEQPGWLTDNQGTIGLYTAGAGSLLAATGLGFHLSARHLRTSTNDQLADEQYRDGDVHTELTQTEVHNTRSRADRFDVVAIATGAVGLLAAATGAYLWWTAPEVVSDEAAVELTVGDEQWSIRWSTRF